MSQKNQYIYNKNLDLEERKLKPNILNSPKYKLK